MTLTKEQQKKVEDNIGLVYKVLHDRVHMQSGIYSMDDFFQIGCIGLCKAVATDKGGTFSTYAYRLIWNEICDALIYSNRRGNREQLSAYMPEVYQGGKEYLPELSIDLRSGMEKAQKLAPPTMARGIQALILMTQGYTCKEIGNKMGASDKLVCVWISRARKFLREQPEFHVLAKSYAMLR